MPAVFVHGVPETSVIWDELISSLERDDAMAISPPGFGAPVPDGFEATADAYRDWLVTALSEIPGPIDLVGHDWGGIQVIRVAIERPDLIRSWATDAAGVFDPAYVWHDLARLWQAPGRGEEALAQALATPIEKRASRFAALGLSMAVATKVAAGLDEKMTRCIPPLYRSAAQPTLMNWGKDLARAVAKPGLVLVATQDQFCGGEAMQRRAATTAGATSAVLDGLGHWWMCQDPQRGATALRKFWSELA